MLSGLRSRSLLYTQLAQSLDAGLALSVALRLADDGRRGDSGVSRGALAAAAIDRGETLVSALDLAFGLPLPDRLALEAAEHAGRLPNCLRALAADREAERRQRSALMQAAAYPLLVLHLLVPAVSTPILLTHPGHFVTRSLVAVGTIWGALLAAYWVHRRGMTSLRYVRALNGVPLVGAVLRASAFTRFFRTLAGLYGSGVRIQEALETSHRVVGPAAPVDDFARAAAAARGGAPLSAAFATMRSLDPPLRALLETAATVGDLEGALKRAVDDLEERWRSLSLRLAKLAASTLYAITVGVVAWVVVSSYVEQLSQYDKLLRH